MKTLICEAPGQLRYQDSEMPGILPGFSLLKIKRIGICGTDLHAYEGTQPYFDYPRILGHELSGEFVEGDAAGFAPGEAVTIIPYFNCGNCIACRAGKTNCCVNMKVCGVHQHGGMVEYLLVPSYALLHGEGLTFDELALVEPLSIGAHAIRRGTVQKGEFVLVIGAGPIGLGTMEFARIAGAEVIALDIHNERLRFCRERLNFINTINAKDADVLQQLMLLTNGDMPGVVIDATGNLNAINNGFKYLAHGGRYILVGLQKGEVSFSHPEFHKREGTLMSSRNATPQDFAHVISCMTTGVISPVSYITHRTAFHDVKDRFESWLNPSSGVIKVMVELN